MGQLDPIYINPSPRNPMTAAMGAMICAASRMSLNNCWTKSERFKREAPHSATDKQKDQPEGGMRVRHDTSASVGGVIWHEIFSRTG
jgi:hypothetical protein